MPQTSSSHGAILRTVRRFALALGLLTGCSQGEVDCPFAGVFLSVTVTANGSHSIEIDGDGDILSVTCTFPVAGADPDVNAVCTVSGEEPRELELVSDRELEIRLLERVELDGGYAMVGPENVTITVRRQNTVIFQTEMTDMKWPSRGAPAGRCGGEYTGTYNAG
jgi:hypothetical protein